MRNRWARSEYGQINLDTKKKDRRLKEQFINNINDGVMTKIIKRELTGIKRTDEIMSEQVLAWIRRVET